MAEVGGRVYAGGMDLIRDPFDDREALMADGRLAGKVFFVPSADPLHPKWDEIKNATFVGWCGPTPMTDINAPAL